MLSEDDLVLLTELLRKLFEKEHRDKILASLTREEMVQLRDYLGSFH